MERRPSIEMGNTKVKAEQRKRTPSRRWMEIHKEKSHGEPKNKFQGRGSDEHSQRVDGK